MELWTAFLYLFYDSGFKFFDMLKGDNTIHQTTWST